MSSRDKSYRYFVLVGSLQRVVSRRFKAIVRATHSRICNDSRGLDLHHFLDELDAAYPDRNRGRVHALQDVQLHCAHFLP